MLQKKCNRKRKQERGIGPGRLRPVRPRQSQWAKVWLALISLLNTLVQKRWVKVGIALLSLFNTVVEKVT